MNKQFTVNGYTMAQAKKIIDNAPIMALDTDDPDYAALMELNRRFQEGKCSQMALISSAFSLGRAIGIRSERVRRNGKVVVQPGKAEIDAAEDAVKRATVTREIAQSIRKLDAIELGATVSTMKAMVEGKSNIEALEVGNAVLVAEGRKPLDVAEIRRNAERIRSA